MRTASPDQGPLEPKPVPLPPVADGTSRKVPMDRPTLEARAMEGDMAAWNALVQRHNHRVVVSLLARGVRLDRAKDLAQDAWLRLIEQQRDGKLSHLQLPGLAIAQAWFLALEAARRARRTEPREDAEVAKLADPRADAETRLLAEEQLARAEQVLSQCSPSARRVFHLAYGAEGLSHAEVAMKVGLSLQRVRQIVCEVRALLRAAVRVEGVGQS
jgi:RNA polymerase sigma factor (sigma-70 family)